MHGDEQVLDIPCCNPGNFLAMINFGQRNANVLLVGDTFQSNDFCMYAQLHMYMYSTLH